MGPTVLRLYTNAWIGPITIGTPVVKCDESLAWNEICSDTKFHVGIMVGELCTQVQHEDKKHGQNVKIIFH